MAGKLIWSPAARDDLRDIVRFIARDNPRRAEWFAYELMTRTKTSCRNIPKQAASFPNTGIHASGEIIFRPYRIVYRLDVERKLVAIA